MDLMLIGRENNLLIDWKLSSKLALNACAQHVTTRNSRTDTHKQSIVLCYRRMNGIVQLSPLASFVTFHLLFCKNINEIHHKNTEKYVKDWNLWSKSHKKANFTVKSRLNSIHVWQTVNLRLFSVFASKNQVHTIFLEFFLDYYKNTITFERQITIFTVFTKSIRFSDKKTKYNDKYTCWALRRYRCRS